MKNTLYYGDNLDVLRKHIKDESIDLIYLDPPFKSNRDYNVLFREANGTESPAQIKVFTDTWRWNQTAEATYAEICEKAPANLVELINGMIHILGRNDVTAYLVNMAIRLLELHRVLKPIGSIYLHCDPTASHYLKLVLDAVFDKKNFRNEIIWHYRKWPSGNRQFQHNHDVIFFYSKSDSKNRPFSIEYME